MDNRLIEEMVNWSPPGYMARKAERIAMLCVERGHIAWAIRIREKNYGTPERSDNTIAFELLIKAGFDMMTDWQTAGIVTTTWICQDCGQEVDRGLMNAVHHWDVCKKDAPNCNISSHEFEVAYKKERKKYDDMLSVLWGKMTPEERQKDFLNSMCGVWDQQSNTMLMGSEAIRRMDEFRGEMRTKYGL